MSAHIMKSHSKACGGHTPGVIKIQQVSRGSKGASKGFIGSQTPPTGGKFFAEPNTTPPTRRCDINKVGPQSSATYLNSK